MRAGHRLAAFPAGALIAMALACGGPGRAARTVAATASPAPRAREIEVPAAPGAIGPSLATAADGRALLSWVEPRDGGRHALRLATRLAGSAWAEPVTVAEGDGWFVNWADFPHAAALDDGTLFVHWMEKRPRGKPYDYDIRLTRSRDGGRTWDRPFSPYADPTPAEHGFVSLAPLGDGRLGVLFLDGREMKAPGGAMSLRFAVAGRSGAPEGDERLDGRVCDCCQTALVRTTRGLVGAYRDRSAGEVRDVAVVRRVGGRWTAPVFPGNEGWEIHGCPVNGPSIAADGDRVALAWYTMAGEAPRVRAAFSSDGGATWGTPVGVDEGRPIGRVDVALLAPGGPAEGKPAAALVSWLEDTDHGAEVRVRRVGADGWRGPSALVARASAARSSGFPRLARTGEEVLVVWRDASEPPRLRAAVLEVRE